MCRRVQRVSRGLQIDTEAVANVEFARLRDQALGKPGMNMPVPRFVGVGQRRTLDLLLEPHVTQLDGLRREAGFDIAQTLAAGQLRKGHRTELFGTHERLHVAGRHHVVRRCGRTCSKAESPSTERTTSCRCSWAAPGKLPPKIARNPIVPLKSTPPSVARNPLLIMALYDSPSRLTGQ